MRRPLRSIVTAALFAATTTLSVSAFAQPAEEGDTPTTEEAPAAAEAEAEAPMADKPKESDKKGHAAFPRISDDQETIYAVQRKAFLIDKKLEFTPMGAASFTDRFVQSFGFAASLTYHLAENFGVEASGTFMFPNEAGLTDEILRDYKLTPEIAKLTQMQWAASLGAQWSPIYGKIEMFGTDLGNFAFYVAAGIGVGQTRVQCTPATGLDPEEFGMGATCETIEGTGSEEDAFKVVYEPSRTQIMTGVAGGVRFYFSNLIGLKLEVKDWIFPARVFRPDSRETTQRFTDAIRNNVNVHVGFSFLFGGEEN